MESIKTELEKTGLENAELENVESIWRKTCPIDGYPVLEHHIETDVVIIGGGMTGILTAWHLQQSGVGTVILEANRIGSGQTENTTAKITSQHGMFCHKFIEKKGEARAAKYFQVNQAAVEMYKKIIGEAGISCDLEECDSYVYSSDDKKLKQEVEAACRLGINASLERAVEVPVSCAGAVCFHGQARFHPLKFMKALAEELIIYENSQVIHVEDHLVKTALGSVKAGKIVFAVHFPFINFPGMHFARMHQERSYVLALEHAGKIDGMYIGDGKDSLSFRQYGKYLLLGGQGHRTGEHEDGQCLKRLITTGKQLYPECSVAALWAAQDCMTTDDIPLIGSYAHSRPDWFVATGFQKWGMTSSMVAAMLIGDMICGNINSCKNVFTPSRFSAEEIPRLAKEGVMSVKGLARRFFYLPDQVIADLEPGRGAIVATQQGKAGVYKTEQGEIYQVDAACPHMGCQLTWNPDEYTWDCPCHGSRFDYKGNLLDGPAQRGL